jgi:aspartate ammonia-lyase
MGVGEVAVSLTGVIDGKNFFLRPTKAITKIAEEIRLLKSGPPAYLATEVA